MRTAQPSIDEAERLSALGDYHILDTPAEKVFDDITSLAATLCEVPVAFIGFIDRERQWFKSVLGLNGARSVCRENALCTHAVLQKETVEVSDTLEDARFYDNPLVNTAPHIRFYLAIPLINDAGYALGTLAVLDYQPKTLSSLQRSTLQKLADVVMSLLETHKTQVQTQSALRQSEQRFKDFAEASTDWLWETDAEHRYSWFSRNVEAVTGVPREWHYGKTRLEITEDDINSPQWQTHLQQLAVRQPFRDFELCRRGPDGLRWIRSNGVPVFDESGVFQGYRGTGTDLTAMREAQIQAQQANDYLTSAIESAQESFALYDNEDRLVFCNQRYLQVHRPIADKLQPGLKFPDMLNLQLEYGLIDEAKGRESEWLEERLQRFRNPQGPFELKRSEDQWVLIQEQRLTDGGLIVTSIDITARKKIEQTLREREQLLRLITDSLPVLIASYDTEQRYQFVNKTFEHWYQRPRDLVLGVHVKDVVGQQAYQVLAPYLETALAGQDISFELERPEPDGGMRCVRGFYVPQLDQHSRTIGIHALIIDIGERQAQEPIWPGGKKWLQTPRPAIAKALTGDISSRLPLPHAHFTHLGDRQMIGESTAMQQLYQLINQIASGDWTVLIEGETGVGKELVARAIHALGARHNGPFIAVNSAGLSESLLASQLFGHRRGAFTGAISDQKGLFEAADGGILFLDEIGDLPLAMQASLLRVLQEKEISRLGETKTRKINVRVIAATHKDLGYEVSTGGFRKDLLYRLRVARINIPALREREGDIALLFWFFLDKSCLDIGKSITDISAQAMQLLLHYHWPGNVRELKTAVDHAVIHCRGQLIQAEHLPPELRQAGLPAKPVKSAEITHHHLQKALEESGGNRTRAARLLGISRATFYRRWQELK